MSTPGLDSSFNVLDTSSLGGLKLAAKGNSPEANKAIAKQFEALFLQVVMKSLRDATPQDGLFGSDSGRMYQSIYDQQLSSVIAQKGGLGLAHFIEQQLNGEYTVRPPLYDLKGPPQGAQGEAAPELGLPYSNSAREFVGELWPQARAAASALGVPAQFLIGQAALETGWGKSVAKRSDGRSSYNLFNIKAGAGWTGPTVEASTTEYENGRAVTRTERFRAYASYAESFDDYARLVGQSPRYASVRGQQSPEAFARALQQSGYATDPAYADKLTRVIGGATLRDSLLASARQPL